MAFDKRQVPLNIKRTLTVTRNNAAKTNLQTSACGAIFEKSSKILPRIFDV